MESPKDPARESALLLKLAPVLFEVCFFVHVTVSLIGWNRPLDDFHGFRQCQTAISAQYLLQDGFKLRYETPVLGKPWSIPEEFPLFQWIVAATSFVFHTPLDPTGRFWSLFIFYLSLLPTYFFLGFLVKERDKRLLILSVFLASPIYLFWSSTFMIESTALCFSALYLWSSVRSLEPGKKRKGFLILAALSGSLAGLVKVTTFLLFVFPAFLFLIRAWAARKTPGSWSKPIQELLLPGLALFVIPFAVSEIWLRFIDLEKALNPMAAGFLTSESLTSWVFGSWTERTTPGVWTRFFQNSHLMGLFGYIPLAGLKVPALLLGIPLALWASPSSRLPLLASLAFFLVPLLVFTNLYFVHDYYFFAADFFLVIFIGILVLAVAETVPEKVRPYLTALLFVLVLSASYKEYYFSYRTFPRTLTSAIPVGQWVSANTRTNDVILIYGLDFDPTLAYYSRRRALMDRWEMSLDNPRMKKAIENLGEDKIGAMLVKGERSYNFIQERIDYFGFDPSPLARGGFYLFLPKKRVIGTPASSGNTR